MIKRKIKVVFHDKDCKFEKYGNWTDLKTSEVINLKPDEFRLIDLGLSMKLPKFYEANVLPRSGTYKKYGITMANSEGIIDTDFCGMGDRWKFPALAHKTQVHISKGHRIAQFKVVLSMNSPWYVKILDLFTKFEFIEVDVLHGKNRGGFGSTGVK